METGTPIRSNVLYCISFPFLSGSEQPSGWDRNATVNWGLEKNFSVLFLSTVLVVFSAERHPRASLDFNVRRAVF